jgi:hypothetical protein
VDADAAEYQQPGTGLASVPQNPLERLPVEQGDRQVDPLFSSRSARDAEMRLVDLGKPGVDDLLVQGLLLLEAEDLRRLLGEHIDDAVEDRVVQVGVIHGHRLDALAEGLSECEGGAQPGERLGRPSTATRMAPSEAASPTARMISRSRRMRRATRSVTLPSWDSLTAPVPSAPMITRSTSGLSSMSVTSSSQLRPSRIRASNFTSRSSHR